MSAKLNKYELQPVHHAFLPAHVEVALVVFVKPDMAIADRYQKLLHPILAVTHVDRGD